MKTPAASSLLPTPLLLSTAGSDRATAYSLSNRLVRLGGKIFASWLDAALHPGGKTRIQLAVVDQSSSQLDQVMLLGEASDNHCGAALALDQHHCLHAILGAHGEDFLHRYSTDPQDATQWSHPLRVGGLNTYPTLIADHQGTLHLAYRECGDRWTLKYRRKKTGAPWEDAQTMAISPTEGYNHFMQSLSVGPDGALHLFFQFHYAENGSNADCETRMAVYLRSHDGGTSWINEDAPSPLPITIDSARPFISYPGGKWRIANHVTDSEGRPWIFVSLPDHPSGGVFRRSAKSWERIDPGEEFSRLNFQGPMGREVSLSRSSDGVIHLVAATRPDEQPSAWFDPAHELFHLRMSESGEPLSLRRLTRPDPTGAQWLPALENWDWTRVESERIDHPWLLFTRGRNLGGIGGDNKNTLQTEVYLMPLANE